MKNYYRKVNSFILLGLLSAGALVAKDSESNKVPTTLQEQTSTSGVVVDTKGVPVIGATVVVQGTSIGASTDIDGKFTIDATAGQKLEVSYIGFKVQTVLAANNMRVVLEEGGQVLEEIALTGTRIKQRVSVNSLLPVDNISEALIKSSGQPTFDKALQTKVPSFNSTTASVSDATSLLDPYEIRGLGPSRALILVNGKRKNLSSLVYIVGTQGLGEVGADLSAISPLAIKEVQILRDGAAAQYGSDAIAGVVNIILKDKVDYTEANIQSGMTREADGKFIQGNLNSGFNFGENDKGFVNYNIGVHSSEITRVFSAVDKEYEKILGGFFKLGEAKTKDDVSKALKGWLVGPKFDVADGDVAKYNEFVNRYNGDLDKVRTDYLAANPGGGNIQGRPSKVQANFSVNAEIPLADGKLYGNAAYIFKRIKSFANHRGPYWRPYLNRGTGRGPITYKEGENGVSTLTGFYDKMVKTKGYQDYIKRGYTPTFEGELKDYNATLGFSKTTESKWNIDGSMTIGGNEQRYYVNDSNNPGLVKQKGASPSDFYTGGYNFTHTVGNIDLSKTLIENDKGLSVLSIALGSEFRSETFDTYEGEVQSQVVKSGAGAGSDSFVGLPEENAVPFSRNNVGFYGEVQYHPIDMITLTGAVRTEDYSDFDDEPIVWKVGAKVDLTKEFTLRANVSTGFRAPAIQQRFFQGGLFNPANGDAFEGTLRNSNPAIKALGVGNLKAEESFSVTAGFGFKSGNFRVTVDGYLIDIDDRIMLSSKFDSKTLKDGELKSTIENNNLGVLNFFINGIDTRSVGLDVVIAYDKLDLGFAHLNTSLAGNINRNTRRGELLSPQSIKDAGEKLLSTGFEVALLEGRPREKAILSVGLGSKEAATEDRGAWQFMVNNTYYGTARMGDQYLSSNEKYLVEFDPRVLTDLVLNYSFNDKTTVSLSANNILSILPEFNILSRGDKTGDYNRDDYKALDKSSEEYRNEYWEASFGGRYSQSLYDARHFDIHGATYMVSLSHKF